MNTTAGTDDYLETDALTNGAQWLTFILDDQEYGVDIQRVQEIKTWTKTTHLPNAPAHVQGVINIRGAIVPIVDLRRQFSLEVVPYTKTTVVLVLTVKRDEAERIVGIVVDAVSDVRDVNEDQMRPPPDMGGSTNVDFIEGIVTVNDQMVIILDVDRLLNANVEALEGMDLRRMIADGAATSSPSDATSEPQSDAA